MNYISLGSSCSVAYQLQKLNLKKETLPFDWMFSTPKFIFEMLELLLENNIKY